MSGDRRRAWPAVAAGRTAATIVALNTRAAASAESFRLGRGESTTPLQ